jgi:hypothetical protein
MFIPLQGLLRRNGYCGFPAALSLRTAPVFREETALQVRFIGCFPRRICSLR